jgi:transposase
MSGFRQAPIGFSCPYRHRCPHMENLSTTFLFEEYHRAREREHKAELRRREMDAEMDFLRLALQAAERENERLKAQISRLQAARFKPNQPVAKRRAPPAPQPPADAPVVPPRPRGAPVGHPFWPRPVPDRIDQRVEIDAPCTCPHCQSSTDPLRAGTHSYLQEDIVLCPRTIVTEFRHATAWCPSCQRQVLQTLPGEIPDAPIGPNTKAAALWLRHELKLPYRKISEALGTLFGIDLVPASILGFEQKARQVAEPLYEDLIANLRTAPKIHADETHWRENGKNHYVFFAGNEQLAVFHIDKSRSTDAAKVLLGDKLDALLIADAYAGYNGIEVTARQSCLAHLIRKAEEILTDMAALKAPDPASRRFCNNVRRLLQLACRVSVPDNVTARKTVVARFQKLLTRACEHPLASPPAETFRKRLMPGAREHDNAFAFILHDGPPTNNLAERALRPLVIFRKVCQGTRSSTGSENISIFSSLTQTAKLQGQSILDLLHQLLTGNPESATEALYSNSV